MDFPADLLTNIFQTEGVESLYWAHYGVGLQDVTIPFGLRPNWSLDIAFEPLLRRLRNRSLHVFHEGGQQTIWIFAFSKDHIQKAESSGFLEEVCVLQNGVLQTEDFAYPGIKDENSGTPLSIVSTGTERQNQASENDNIYEMAMRALSSSMSFFLSRHFNWMQVGPETSVGQAPCPRLPSHPAQQDFHSTIVRFEVTSSSEGCLLYFVYRDSIPEIQSLDCRPIENVTLDASDVVVISPFGTVLRYNGVSSRSEEQHFKDFVGKQLKLSGVDVPPETPWVKLTDPETPLNDHTSDAASSKLVWPANLVLCLRPQSIEDVSLSPSSEAQKLDQIGWAQHWFRDRTSRTDLTQTLQREVKMLAQRSAQLATLADNEASDEVFTPVSPVMPNQDAAGIYPTPSDGFPSQGPEVDQHSTPFEPSDRENSGGDGLSRMGAENGPRHTVFDEVEADMDIFATNDLTEADFNFFDEPDLDEEGLFTLTENHDEDAMREVERALLEAPISSSPALPDPLRSEEQSQFQISEVSPSTAAMEDASIGKLKSEESMITITDPHAKDSRLVIIDTKENPEGPDLMTKATARSELTFQPNHDRKTHPNGLNRGSFFPLSALDSNFEDKYGSKGRFGFQLIEPPKRAARSQTPDWRYGLRSPQSPQQIKNVAAESSTSASESDSDAESSVSEHEVSMLRYAEEDSSTMELEGSLKRKRSQSHATIQALSPSSPTDLMARNRNISRQHLLSFKISSIPKTPYKLWHEITYQHGEIAISPFTGNDQVFIQVAQLVVDQLAHSSQLFRDMYTPPLFANASRVIPVDSIEMVMQESLSKSIRNLAFADLIRHSPEQEGDGKVNRKMLQNPIKIDSPFVSVRRNGTRIDISNSAVPFWEELGFSPAHDRKNIQALCVYIDRDYLQDNVTFFLREMESAYQACNLGDHSVLESYSNNPLGHVKIKPEEAHLSYDHADLLATLNGLGKHLASLRHQDANTVIYIANFDITSSALPFLCNAFWRLFESYRAALLGESMASPNDLVLQIVPANMVISLDKVAIPSFSACQKLAFEVYDRCAPPKSKNLRITPPFASASAISLCRPLPRVLDFRLTPDPSGILSKEDSCLYLAYAWQAGENWLTASWTDGVGSKQWNASYWIGQDEDANPPFSSVVSELWATSQEIQRSTRSSFRLHITKDSPYADFELTAWLALAPDSPTKITLLSIDPIPPLTLWPPSLLEDLPQPPGSLNTPTSTPQSAAMSPDVPSHNQISTPTPSQGLSGLSEGDAHAKLIDITDDTWAAILDHDPFEPWPRKNDKSLTGYLIKRAGANDEDGVLLTQVKIAHGLGDVKALMRFSLHKYRNLASLARLRNITDSRRGTLPIHVAAARKAHDVLEKTMRYEDDLDM